MAYEAQQNQALGVGAEAASGDGLASVVGNSVGTLVLRGASFAVRVICVLFAARKAGPEKFGTISLLFTMAEITRVVADCGVDITMLRNMATLRGDELRRSLGAALSAKALAALASGLVLFAATWVMSPGTPGLNVAVLALAFTPLLLNLGSNYFIATQRTASVWVAVSVMTVAAIVLCGALFVFVDSPTPMIWAAAAYELLIAAWLMRALLRSVGGRLHWASAGAAEVARTALPLGIATLVGYVYGKFDVFIIDRMCGRWHVGQYSVWVRTLEPVLFVCGAIAVTAYGQLSVSIHHGEWARARVLLRRYAALSVGVSGGACLALLVAGRLLAEKLYPAFLPSLWMGQVLAGLLVLRSINGILTALLQAAAKNKLIMKLSFVNFAVALIGSVSLAKIYGAAGVLLGLIVMESVNCAFQSFCASGVLASPGVPVRREAVSQ